MPDPYQAGGERTGAFTGTAVRALLLVDVTRSRYLIDAECLVLFWAGVVATRVVALMAHVSGKFERQVIGNYMDPR